MAAIVCAACGTPSAGHRQGRPWCRPCGIWLVRCELTGEWVSFAERERRQARYAELIDQTRQAAQAAVELARAVVPHGWRVRAGQPLPGACYTLDVQPPASPADVYAYLTPPHSGHGWRVAIYHRTRGVDFPLYTDGGARAAEYPTAEEAVSAAVTALRIETGEHEVYGGDEETFDEGLWVTCVDVDNVNEAEDLAKTAMIDNDG